MARKIAWYLSIGYPSARQSDEIEVDDDATDDEIEAIVSEEVHNYIEWGWKDAK